MALAEASQSATQTSPVVNADAARVSPALVTLAGWAWRALVVAAAGAALIWIMLQFSVIVVSILLSLLIAVVAHPLVAFLQRKAHFPPLAAASVTLLAIILFVGALIGGSGTGLYQGFSDLGDKIQAGIANIVAWINATFPNLQEQVNSAWASAQEFLTNNSGRIAGGLMTVGSSFATFATAAILILFTLFFFLKDGRGLWQWFVRLWPERYRDPVNESGIRAWVTLGNYARTQAIVALFDAVAIAAVAAILGTPFSLVFPIGALVFIGAFIPVVGSLISGIVAVLVVLVVTGKFTMALIMLIGVLAVQQIEGNLLSPMLQGNALNLHAWAILLLVTGGSMVAGVLGALFTVPLAAAVNTVILYLRGHDTYPYLNRQEHRPGGPKEPFAHYAEAHWEEFDREVAQQLPPREARKAKRAAKRAKKAAK